MGKRAIFLPLEQMEGGGTFRHTALGSVPKFILAGVILGSGGSWWPLSVCSSTKLCLSRCHHLNWNLTNFFKIRELLENHTNTKPITPKIKALIFTLEAS